MGNKDTNKGNGSNKGNTPLKEDRGTGKPVKTYDNNTIRDTSPTPPRPKRT